MIEEAETGNNFSLEERLLDLSTKSRELAETAVRHSIVVPSLLFNIYLVYVVLSLK